RSLYGAVIFGRAIASRAAGSARLRPLSLHDALPIWAREDAVQEVDVRLEPFDGDADDLEDSVDVAGVEAVGGRIDVRERLVQAEDRKSTRLHSSHVKISYAVFCLKKKTGEQLRLSSG